MIPCDKVTAVIVTRGNVPLDDILTTLPYKGVIVWNNAREGFDAKVFGRYMGALRSANDVVYVQDDDVIFEDHKALLDEYEGGKVVANYAHGTDDGGYGDLPILSSGALFDKRLIMPAFMRYLAHYPADDDFLYYCDFAFGVLTRFKHVELPWTRLYADDPSRLCKQTWAEEVKFKVTSRARRIRDGKCPAE